MDKSKQRRPSTKNNLIKKKAKNVSDNEDDEDEK